jgi:hypothetical protein
MPVKSLDAKLKNIYDNPSSSEFIIADAKDADMRNDEDRFRSLQDYRQLIRDVVKQGLVDIILASSSTNELLNIKERIFDDSHITPAVRMNDTTDIWCAKGSVYTAQPSKPFRSAAIDHAMAGKLNCTPQERGIGADLGLYSITFNNDTALDHNTLVEYARFREEAESKGFKHFLEVFSPNALQNPVDDIERFVNDNILRTLAGIAGKSRPLFLKIPYYGPKALDQLVSYDNSLVVGILGGSSGTTLDAFHQLWEAKKYGAKVALYGRMINNSEHQLIFIQHLRWIADGEINDPIEAVKSYHSKLREIDIIPYRTLQDDLVHTSLMSKSYELSKKG